jgi:hypothetical protein
MVELYLEDSNVAILSSGTSECALTWEQADVISYNGVFSVCFLLGQQKFHR